MEKKLDAVSVLQRVRGCGEPEARALVAELGLTDTLVEAYKKGGDAVEAEISKAVDAKAAPVTPATQDGNTQSDKSE